MRFSHLLLVPLPCAAPLVAQTPEHHVVSVGDAVDGDGPTHMAWTPDGSALLVLNEQSRNVAFLDGATMATIGVAPVGAGALDLEITPDGHHALVPSSIDGTLHVLDVATRTSAAVIALSSPVPYGVEVASDSSFAVVTSYGDATAVSSVSVVDLLALRESSRFSAPGQGPYKDVWSGEPRHPGVELAADDRTLLLPLPNDLTLVAYDVTTGVQVAQLTPADPFQVPVVVRADPTGTRAAVLCADLLLMGWFEVYVVDLTSWTWSAAGLWFLDQGGPSEREFALTPDGSEALVAGQDLHFVDLATATASTVAAEVWGGALEVTSDGATAIVAPRGTPFPMRAFDVATRTETGAVLRVPSTSALVANPLDARIAALESTFDENVALVDASGGGLALLGRAPTGPGEEGDGPTTVVVDPTGAFALTANELSDNLTLIDLAQHRAVAWIPVHDRPMDVELFEAGGIAAVWHADGRLSVVDVASRTVLTSFATGAVGSSNKAPKQIVPFGGDRLLLYAAPSVAVVEVNGAASRVLGNHEVFGGFAPEQPLSISAAGIVGFPRSNLHDVQLFDVNTITPLSEVPTVLHPRAAATTADGHMYVGGGGGLQRFQVNGPPKDLGTADILAPLQFRVDEAAGFAYVRSGSVHSKPTRLVVVDVASMQVVAEFELPDWAVDLELAGPHAFVALRDGTLLRYRADGANTQLLSSHPTRGEPTDLVVGPDGRTVLVVQRGRDEVDEFEF